MKKIQNVITLLIISTLGGNVYASESDIPYINASQSGYTIKELQENIRVLTEEKSTYKSKWEFFRIENGKINDFIISPITDGDSKNIETIISSYYEIIGVLNEKVEISAKNLESTTSLKEEIINNKIELFKKLVPYIRKDMLTEYLSYIKANIEIERSEKNLKDEILRNQGLFESKIIALKEKIEENKKVLDEKMENLVNQKVDEKIKKIFDNEKFKILDIILQKKVFETTYEKVLEKKELLYKIDPKTSIVEKKIEIYSIVEMKLIEVIESIK